MGLVGTTQTHHRIPSVYMTCWVSHRCDHGAGWPQGPWPRVPVLGFVRGQSPAEGNRGAVMGGS